MTIPLPTDAAGQPVSRDGIKNQEEFFNNLEKEMVKIERFTKKEVCLFYC